MNVAGAVAQDDREVVSDAGLECGDARKVEPAGIVREIHVPEAPPFTAKSNVVTGG
jgi:hypothetical protein